MCASLQKNGQGFSINNNVVTKGLKKEDSYFLPIQYLTQGHNKTQYFSKFHGFFPGLDFPNNIRKDKKFYTVWLTMGLRRHVSFYVDKLKIIGFLQGFTFIYQE